MMGAFPTAIPSHKSSIPTGQHKCPLRVDLVEVVNLPESSVLKKSEKLKKRN